MSAVVEIDGGDHRSGTVLTASAHAITAVIGSGILSLPWSISKFGWAVGPPILLAFSAITYIASLLLADCYRTRYDAKQISLLEAVKSILGTRAHLLCALVAQYSNLVGSTIGYTITASMSMVVFGAFQLLLSQIPDVNRLWWLSILAAFMSFGYSSLGLGLSIDKVVDDGFIRGSPIGSSSSRTIWEMLQALGNIAFAYNFSSVLLEVQDTIKSPGESAAMKKATTISTTITTLFYLAVACAGYAAFGEAAPGNILTGFSSPRFFWLVDAANIFLIVHLLGAYQIFAQPLYAGFEARRSTSGGECSIMGVKVNLFRVAVRITYVLIITLVSLIFPFFNSVIGLVGAITFWPLTVYLPVEMYSKQNQLKALSWKRLLLQLMSVVSLAISLGAAAGSLQGVVSASKEYNIFDF